HTTLFRSYFTGGHNYTNSFGTGLPGSKIHVNRSNFTLGMQHAVSRRWALTAAANGIHRYGATVSCTHYGALFGVAVHPNSRTDLAVSVGPELGDTGCIQPRLVTYQGFATVHLTRHWSVYAAAERSTSAPIFLPAAPAGASLDQLTHTVAAGVMRDAIGGHLEMRLDGGYISTEGGTRIRPFNTQGKFIAPQVGWRLTRTLGTSATYRRIYQLSNAINGNRNQFFVTLDWRPDAPEKSGPIHWAANRAAARQASCGPYKISVSRRSKKEDGRIMTSNDIFNQPAEQVREYWQTLLQHKWQVYFTTLALTLAAIVGISLLPDQYQVTTTILVDPQKVPDEYIPATIKSPLTERLQTITQEVLSATRLQEVIDKWNLYHKMHGSMSSDQLIEYMRGKIKIEVKRASGAGPAAFSITYEGEN